MRGVILGLAAAAAVAVGCSSSDGTPAPRSPSPADSTPPPVADTPPPVYTGQPAPTATAPSPPPPATSTPPGDCHATGSQVVMIGDSYLALSGETTAQLLRYARGAGTLGESDAYRTYYVSGTQMSGGIIQPSIPSQFQQAVTADRHIRYVVMDGGGNDILVGNSSCITTSPAPANASCAKTLKDAVDAATGLFQEMKAAGVEKVVYFFYPHLPTSGKPYVNQMLDYAFPIVKAACEDAIIPCYFVDTRPAFEGHPEYIGPDGIHPTAAGSDVIATLVWEQMQQACVAQ